MNPRTVTQLSCAFQLFGLVVKLSLWFGFLRPVACGLDFFDQSTPESDESVVSSFVIRELLLLHVPVEYRLILNVPVEYRRL